MPVAAVAAVLGVGTSVYQTLAAKKKEKEAQEALDNYERQDITNPYANLQVSTMGADMQQQNLNLQVAGALEALRSGGSRAVLGGAPNMYDSILKSNQQIAADLDRQYNENQRLEAEGNAMVQGMTDQRERDDLLGLGNAVNVYRNEANQGITSIVKSAFSVADAANAGGLFKKGTPESTSGQSGTAVQNNLYNPPAQNNGISLKNYDQDYLKKLNAFNGLKSPRF